MFDRIRNLYLAFLSLCGLIAGLIIGTIAVLISLDIVMRNLGGPNLPWLLDTSEYALFVVTFLAAPWALRMGTHVRLDVALRALPPQAAKGLEIFADAIGMAVSLTLAYYGLDVTLKAVADNAYVFKYLVFPEWWMLWLIPASALLLALEFLLRAVRVARGTEAVVTEFHFDAGRDAP